MDPAPACGETPDFLSALNIRCTTVARGVVRLNQLHVMVRWQANTQIHGPTQTEPSPWGLCRSRGQCNQHVYNAIFLFVLFLLEGSSVHKAGLCSLELFSSPSPSVASALTAVPPKSVGQSGNHFARSTRLTTLAGTEVASDRRQRHEHAEGNNPWHYS